MSDSHGGFELGLTNPETKTRKQDNDKDTSIALTETNIFLYNDVFKPGLDKTKHLAGKDPIIAIHDGDIAHGIKYMDEAIDSRVATQFIIAVENMKEVLRIPNVKMMRLISGTSAHSFGQGSVDEMVAYTLREGFPKIDIAAYHHDLLDVNGFTIDCAHHGPYTGSRNWLKGNVAKLYLQSLMEDEIGLGNIPPKMVLRGHYHEYVKVWHGKKQDGYYFESWLIVAPPLSLLSDWGRQATQSAYILSPGLLALEVIDGRLYETHFFGKTLDIRKKEKIKL